MELVKLARIMDAFGVYLVEIVKQHLSEIEWQQLLVIENEIRLHLPQQGQVRRLFHGRGGCFSGLKDVVIDAYPPVIVIFLYSERSSVWLDALRDVLLRQALGNIEAIVVQQREQLGVKNRVLWGGLNEKFEVEEQGLKYQLRFHQNQNIGFFPDMAVGRQIVRQISQGKRVLNLFSYTCSFSVAALAGGAKQVVNLDMNRSALDMGRINHQLNQLDLRSVSFLAMECFKSQSRLRKLGPYDLIICDPPASQGNSFNANQHWPKLLKRVVELVAPQGKLLLCMNGPVRPGAKLDQLIVEHLSENKTIEHYSPNDQANDFPDYDGFGETALRLIQL